MGRPKKLRDQETGEGVVVLKTPIDDPELSVTPALTVAPGPALTPTIKGGRLAPRWQVLSSLLSY